MRTFGRCDSTSVRSFQEYFTSCLIGTSPSLESQRLEDAQEVLGAGYRVGDEPLADRAIGVDHEDGPLGALGRLVDDAVEARYFQIGIGEQREREPAEPIGEALVGLS